MLVGGLDLRQAQAAELRGGGIPVIALASDDPRADALAAAEGWRFVGHPDGTGLRIVDRADGAVLASTTPLEPIIAPLRICMPLGALYQDAIALLEAARVDVAPLRAGGRKLVFRTDDGTVFITTRPSDVPTYVEAGAADIGIVGRDVINERRPDVYELLDLKFGGCRMVYATAAGEDPTPEIIARLGVLRVATKYPQVAEAHFLATGRQVELVKVNGSVELGPLVGLADGIVDLVATGRTLRENGLVEREEIFHSSAHLIANRVSHKLRAEDIDALTARLAQAVAAEAVSARPCASPAPGTPWPSAPRRCARRTPPTETWARSWRPRSLTSVRPATRRWSPMGAGSGPRSSARTSSACRRRLSHVRVRASIRSWPRRSWWPRPRSAPLPRPSVRTIAR